jgi:hypothetical protein
VNHLPDQLNHHVMIEHGTDGRNPNHLDLLPNCCIDPYTYGSHGLEPLPWPAAAVADLNYDSSWPQALTAVDMPWLQSVPPAHTSINHPDNLLDPIFFGQDLLQLSASMMPSGIQVAAPTPSAVDVVSNVGPSIPDKNVVEPALTCPRGCPGSFRRPGDYRRHMRKHEQPRYKCPKFDCDKTFYRADKMRDHVRQGHKGLLV